MSECISRSAERSPPHRRCLHPSSSVLPVSGQSLSPRGVAAAQCHRHRHTSRSPRGKAGDRTMARIRGASAPHRSGRRVARRARCGMSNGPARTSAAGRPLSTLGHDSVALDLRLRASSESARPALSTRISKSREPAADSRKRRSKKIDYGGAAYRSFARRV